MALYTANIISTNTLPDGRTNIEVQYTNGTITTQSKFIIPSDNVGLEYQVRQDLSVLNFIAPPLGAYVLPVPPTPPTPTQADIDFANFSKWLQLTVAINAAKQLTWITGSEQMVTDAKNKTLALAAINLPKMFL